MLLVSPPVLSGIQRRRDHSKQVMKRAFNIRAFLSLLLMAAMFSPTAVLAFGDGKKHFKQGMKHEASEEWDKAAEEFALAVADNGKNPEYKLHLTRALFMASQMYIKKGTLAANEKDYQGGYVAFRKAYAYDPTNDFAKSEMARMVRLQEELNNNLPGAKKDDKLKLVPTSFGPQGNPAAQIPQRLEKLRDLLFPSGVDLQAIIKELARDLDLNVLFDTESFRTPGRKTNIELKGVTAARALDYIFLQEGLFFQRVGPHTIMVALQSQRTKFQQLVLRTFYLANAAPKDIAKVVQTAIPAQPGRSQTIVLTDDATNSVTIRDTEENIRLIGQLIKSLDKDRAEVVMDVAIYEVNKSDLLQFGNQIGSATTLANLGGAGLGSQAAGSSQPITTGMPFKLLDLASVAFALPISSFQAFQSKSNTKLIASTQIHAFNNEDSSARIGQRVPVQSAQIYNGTNTTGGNTGNNGFVSNVINYEQVGLTLKFKPLVFPNQDVQVAMEIESKDVAGASTLTPTFTERTIKGTARVQNNKTLLLASVAQGVETNGRQGIPILGLIPILGRLFTSPTKDNRQVDIVIAVTPRVIRAPAILPEDEIERPTGSLAVPTQNSLEAMVIEDEQQDMLAAARRMPNAAEVQLPDRTAEAPEYVRETTTNSALTGTNGAAMTNVSAESEQKLRPIDSTVKTLQLKETSDVVNGSEMPTVEAVPAGPSVELTLGSSGSELKKGERTKVAVMVTGNSAFSSAVLGLKYDAKKVAVRAVTIGDVYGVNSANKTVVPFLNQNGKTFVSLIAADGRPGTASGVLAYVEVEALVDGVPAIEFDRDVLNFLTGEGKNFSVKLGL